MKRTSNKSSTTQPKSTSKLSSSSIQKNQQNRTSPEPLSIQKRQNNRDVPETVFNLTDVQRSLQSGTTLQKNESARLQDFMKNRSTYLDDEIQKMREKLKSEETISTPQYKPRDFIGEMNNKYNEIFDTDGIRNEYNDNDNYRTSRIVNSINEKKT
mmetsp:Transcript_32299/g.30796  ORF Transcript_32299/g.30796 Transcript_32299/m.30796 type:complete len:156 (-) Transcript_32299:101-568(-)